MEDQQNGQVRVSPQKRKILLFFFFLCEVVVILLLKFSKFGCITFSYFYSLSIEIHIHRMIASHLLSKQYT